MIYKAKERRIYVVSDALFNALLDCVICNSITLWNCDFARFPADFEPFVSVSLDFWICGLYLFLAISAK